MIKRLVIFTIAIMVIATSVLFCQKWYISSQAESLSYSLNAIYIFHFIAYLIIVVAVELLSKKLPNQVGFFYLASVFIKIGFFVLIFKDAIFAEIAMNFLERISIIIPFFMFLVFEAIYSGRLMNAQ
ncbi:hypothetical protein MATR_36100 [Marivirga tractuosa]|uniref:Uncharacterized protein n=1 Tax=Marivirga tractuosa (strain ATCC 23168 / DSM 4126 / NBRC 15989 / NCIMB 1408 / VKM B-1430 / H-43) TaxID=643867 RepID=E4TNY0_MARTH|nr:DUF6168 family protein [Marivirga tractuosa]ADR22544.1 hypothetical protein Ftrac_2566 [Marivirga tractuosa DSM 4126]BDD16785.1 hypothetical protein MATR_36100 [Marivirga tractuosa]